MEKFKKGDILSEISYYTVDGFDGNKVLLKADNGKPVEISRSYLESYAMSGDFYDTEQECTMTELSEILASNARVAMTVCFRKKDGEKTKKAFDAEKKAKIEEIQSASLKNAAELLANLIENPITRVIPGEMRVMRGRHYGQFDTLGRMHFIDMEQKYEVGKETDSRMRQIDPRTITYIIVGNVRYNLKK